MANVPADSVWGCDNVLANRLPDGFGVYAGYGDGPYANMTAIKNRFPVAYLISVTVRGIGGSMAIDAEPGTLSSSQAGNFNAVLAWLRNGHSTAAKPIIYTMASWAQALVNFLAGHGFGRDTYFLWTAHYVGQHLCGADCSYLSGTVADATQYATGYNDYNVFRGYMVGHGGTQVATPGIVKLGSTGALVVTVQKQLNTWAKYCKFPALTTDGDFGGKTYSAVRLFQAKRGQGLAVDGVVGPNTEKYLQNPPGPVKKIIPVPVPKPVLPSGIPAIRSGDAGKAVAEIQYYLRNSGIYGVRGIEADGDFGPQTLTSLRNFQVHAHLIDDGVYGPATAKVLAKVALG